MRLSVAPEWAGRVSKSRKLWAGLGWASLHTTLTRNQAEAGHRLASLLRQGLRVTGWLSVVSDDDYSI